MKKIGSFQYGISVSAVKENTGVRLLRITDITDDGIKWEEVPYCKIDQEKINKYKLNVGGVLFARIGATTGKSCFIKQPVKAVFGSYLIRFISKVKELNTNFLYVYTQSEAYWKQVNKMKMGQLKKGLNTKLLGELLIPLPPLQEQQKIVEILSTWDELIQTKKKKVEKLERMKKKIMELLLTGKVRVRL